MYFELRLSPVIRFAYTLFPRKEKDSKIKEDKVVSEKVSNQDSPSTKKQKKRSQKVRRGFIVSFNILSYAMEDIPLSSAYAVWTGIGTLGPTIVGIFL